MALLVLSLLAVPLIKMYDSYIKGQKFHQTDSSLAAIEKAMNSYVQNQRHYPAPASFVANPEDPDPIKAAKYGVEGNPNPLLCTDAAWSTTDGMCRTSGADSILIGAVPFKALGLDEHNAYDFWGRRILYAVTKSQTNIATYIRNEPLDGIAGNDWGHIVVKAIQPNGSEYTVNSNYDAIFVSLGETGKGAYTLNGKLVAPCPDSSINRDGQNCDLIDNVFLLDEQDFDINPDPNVTQPVAIGTRAFAKGPNFYDDVTLPKPNVILDAWFHSDTADDYALTMADRLGIGTNDPTNKVHVKGNVLVDENTLSNEYCSWNGTTKVNCFDPEIFAGNLSKMDCNQSAVSGTKPVMKLANNRVYCSSPINHGGTLVDGTAGQAVQFKKSDNSLVFSATNCGASNKLMVGIDSAGVPICVIP